MLSPRPRRPFLAAGTAIFAITNVQSRKVAAWICMESAKIDSLDRGCVASTDVPAIFFLLELRRTLTGFRSLVLAPLLSLGLCSILPGL